jgi:hypothetical protein
MRPSTEAAVLDQHRGWLHNNSRGCCEAQHRRLGDRLGKRAMRDWGAHRTEPS